MLCLLLAALKLLSLPPFRSNIDHLGLVFVRPMTFVALDVYHAFQEWKPRKAGSDGRSKFADPFEHDSSESEQVVMDIKATY